MPDRVSMSVGDPCPYCRRPIERRENMFFWRGHYRPGAVCSTCKALWSLTGFEIPPLDPVNPRNDW